MDLEEGTSVRVSDLTEGHHTIYATVSDGEVAITHWVNVQMGEVRGSSTDDGYGFLCAGAISALVIVVVGGVIIGFVISRDGGEEAPAPTVEETRVVTGGSAATTDRDHRMMRQRDAERRREEETRDQERAEAARAAEEERKREARLHEKQLAEERRKAARERRFLAPEPEEPDVFEPVVGEPSREVPETAPSAATAPLPTEDDMERKKDQLVRAIGSLPGGLPSSLSLYDPPTIAKRIVKGRKKRSKDGRLLAFVQGEWYYADPGDRDFMNPYEGR
jgi:hypothetical protein